MATSLIKRGGLVTFPPFMGERVYMREFTHQNGLPPDLRRWQPTVDAMLADVETNGPIYLMVDEGFVQAGNTHRRGGPHVDGRWVAAMGAHGAHGDPYPHHLPMPEPRPEPPHPRHSLRVSGHHGHRFDGATELIVFASDVLGCRAYLGDYDDTPAEDGNCAHFDLDSLTVINMEPYHVWTGDACTTIHESTPVKHDCLRTMVRLNVAG
jgi:hypothetical protein